MTRTKIKYAVGMAKDGTGPVDYMLGRVDTEDGIIELYAETPILDDETGTFEPLRREILEQAVKEGIDVGRLAFYYD